MTDTTKQFDIIVYGATSFVGQIMLEYLADYQGEPITWAIAGRNEQKLLDAKQDNNLSHIPHIIAHANDEAALLQCVHKPKLSFQRLVPMLYLVKP